MNGGISSQLGFENWKASGWTEGVRTATHREGGEVHSATFSKGTVGRVCGTWEEEGFYYKHKSCEALNWGLTRSDWCFPKIVRFLCGELGGGRRKPTAHSGGYCGSAHGRWGLGRGSHQGELSWNFFRGRICKTYGPTGWEGSRTVEWEEAQVLRHKRQGCVVVPSLRWGGLGPPRKVEREACGVVKMPFRNPTHHPHT